MHIDKKQIMARLTRLGELLFTENTLDDTLVCALSRVRDNPAPHEDPVAHRNYWEQQLRDLHVLIENSNAISKNFQWLRVELAEALPPAFEPNPNKTEVYLTDMDAPAPAHYDHAAIAAAIKQGEWDPMPPVGDSRRKPLIRNETTVSLADYLRTLSDEHRRALERVMENGTPMSTGNRALDSAIIKWFTRSGATLDKEFVMMRHYFEAAGGLPPEPEMCADEDYEKAHMDGEPDAGEMLVEANRWDGPGASA